jgi:hypothetical protein
MKFDVLRSIGHNIADSFASGLGLMIGVYAMNVFGEAKAGADGFIEVNFLDGTSSGAPVSPSLANAIRLYAKALPDLCHKQGATADAFRTLSARFFTLDGRPHYSVTIEDQAGRRVTDAYAGVPGVRIRS